MQNFIKLSDDASAGSNAEGVIGSPLKFNDHRRLNSVPSSCEVEIVTFVQEK